MCKKQRRRFPDICEKPEGAFKHRKGVQTVNTHPQPHADFIWWPHWRIQYITVCVWGGVYKAMDHHKGLKWPACPSPIKRESWVPPCPALPLRCFAMRNIRRNIKPHSLPYPTSSLAMIKATTRAFTRLMRRALHNEPTVCRELMSLSTKGRRRRLGR